MYKDTNVQVQAYIEDIISNIESISSKPWLKTAIISHTKTKFPTVSKGEITRIVDKVFATN